MSRELDKGMIPARLLSPCVPRRPTRLLCAEGTRIEPHVSLPMPAAARVPWLRRSLHLSHRGDAFDCRGCASLQILNLRLSSQMQIRAVVFKYDGATSFNLLT